MMPIGPLMIEHRLIERMIALMENVAETARTENRIDVRFIDSAVHFIREYADRCHHGKEEDILFRELEKKTISREHNEIMRQLIEEHKWGRKTTAKLAEASERYDSGAAEAFEAILENLQALARFYPRHIATEDKNFFLPVMEYFSDNEKSAMLQEGYEIDSRLLHEAHEHSVTGWEKETGFSFKKGRTR